MTALFYDDYYQAILTSRAHALYCERVYGKNLAQHGTADMAQIALLLEELQIAPSMSVLDFGCGDGRISEYIADVTGACLTGLDISTHAIELAQQRTASKQDRLRFVCADLEDTPEALPPATFDRIITIDSIFFAKDQKTMLDRLLNLLKPGGSMGILYLSPPAPKPDAGQTVLGQALAALGLPYAVHDLSAQSYQHWITKRAVLQELEPLFYEEGHAFLFKNRMAECQGDPEHFQRYLFIVKTD
jgi:cyclopropane fatty-acyl-phospholipid synthase-like methyltransferase